jgi:hypothetical protein
MNKREPTAAKPDLPYQPDARIERRFANSAAQFWAATDNVNQMQSQTTLARIRSAKRRFTAIACVLLLPSVIRAGENGTTDFPVLRRPLTKVEALNIAIARNGTILQAKKDVEAATGIAIQTKAIVYPHVEQRAEYVARNDSLIEQNEGPVAQGSPIQSAPEESASGSLLRRASQRAAVSVAADCVGGARDTGAPRRRRPRVF